MPSMWSPIRRIWITHMTSRYFGPLSHVDECSSLFLLRSPISVMSAARYRQLVLQDFGCCCEPFLVVSLLLKSLNSIFIVWLLGLVTMPQCHAAMPCLPQTQCMNDCTKGCALESKVSHLRRSCVHFGQSGFAKSRSTCDRLGARRRLSSRVARS